MLGRGVFSQLTKNMPQREHIIIARSRRLEGRCFQPAPSIVKKEEVFYMWSANRKPASRAFARLRTMRWHETLWTGVT